MRAPRWLLLAVLAVGCGDDVGSGGSGGSGGGDGGPIPGLMTVEVLPAMASLTVHLPGAAMSQAYTATGVFQDGSRRDVTSQVAWTVDNAAVGAIAAGGLF